MSTEQLTGLQLAVKLLAQIGDNDSDAAIAAVHAVMDQGQPGELPDGLQLAATLLDGDRDAFICGQAHPVHGLAPSDEEIAAGYLTAIAAIRAEHAQRLTLQHHACDQAQRIADLETRRDTLKRLHDAAADERDELRAKYDELLVALHGIGAALGIPEGDRSPYSVTCGVLERVNRLAEIEAQEPVAISKAGNLFWAGNPQDWRGVDCSLYATHVPAQAVPESVDGLVSVFCYDEVLTFTFCDEAAADRFAGRFDPSVDSAEAPEHKA